MRFKKGDIVIEYIEHNHVMCYRKYRFHEYHTDRYGKEDKQMKTYALTTLLESTVPHDCYIGDDVWAPFGKFELARESKVDLI